ncbi:MAG: haloacid dehalogenase-like hydrolase [Chloroflexota bacterium]|nr:MAG: haloacid dehalogenase-like hydrolase [Chloroflexota bacterium]
MSLLSWNDTPTKQAILNFMNSTNDKNSQEYIPLSERVAAFDNDGTLWVEQPAPAQTGLLIGKLVEQVKADPSLAEVDPYKGIVSQDPEFMQGLAQQVPEVVIAFLSGIGKAWEGTTPEAYEAEVQAFLAGSMHPRYNRPWTDLVYQPMLELFDLLSENGWRIFVCSGGGRDFMRVFSEQAWGIYRENVIGSAPEYEYQDGQLLRQNKLHGNIALGPGKPEHIYARTGRRALFAGGNGDVDLEMLQEARFRLVVVHDDEEREYVVTAGAEKLLVAGEEGSWTMVSMKDDWKTIFKD